MREATNGKYPRYAVFENVPGIFSSNNGEDFRLVLEEFCKIKRQEISIPLYKGKWPDAGEIVGDDFSLVWRVLDSKYFSVPQRRARIFLVADFASECASKILFEPEGLSWDSEACSFTWQGTAYNIENSTGETGYCINEQGGQFIDISHEKTGTLRAQMNGHAPCIVEAAGFCTEHSSASRSIGYEEEKSPTLRAGVVPATLLFDNHAQEARYNGPLAESPTITARYGTGGGNTPLIAESIYGISRQSKPSITENLAPALVEKGPHNVAITYGVCSKNSNSMQSDNPHSGFYEADTSRTLDCNGGNPTCSQSGMAIVEAYRMCHNNAKETDISCTLDATSNHVSSQQGGMIVVNKTYDVRFTSEGTQNARGHCYETDISRCLDTGGENPDGNHGGVCIVGFSVNQRDECRDLKNCAGALQAQPGMKQQTFVLQGSMIGRDNTNGPQGDGVNEDVSFCLNTVDRHAIATPAQEAQEDKTYCSTVGSFMHVEEEKANTLMARDYKDPQIINELGYTVRRLTPLECCRLQGFPDEWCDNLAISNPTDDDINFWMEVWKTWNEINGKKPKTEKQVRKWLANPYSDSEIYKMWGNGVSLPVVYFVLNGIKSRAE